MSDFINLSCIIFLFSSCIYLKIFFSPDTFQKYQMETEALELNIF